MNNQVLTEYDEELKQIRLRAAKRPAALRKAQRDISKVRSNLIAVGYKPGDRIYEAISKLVVAVASDITR
jgi:predicted  nucleic acid-binding Zn-ribbon protein